MRYHSIDYDLGCKKCFTRFNYSKIISTEFDRDLTLNELISEIMSGKEQCANCGNKANINDIESFEVLLINGKEVERVSNINNKGEFEQNINWIIYNLNPDIHLNLFMNEILKFEYNYNIKDYQSRMDSLMKFRKIISAIMFKYFQVELDTDKIDKSDYFDSANYTNMIKQINLYPEEISFYLENNENIYNNLLSQIKVSEEAAMGFRNCLKFNK